MLWRLTCMVLFCIPFSYAINENKIATLIEITYTEFESDAIYGSTIPTEKLGPIAVYDLTNSFIDAVITGPYPEDLILVDESGNVEIKDNDYIAFLNHYKGLFALLIFLVIFAILLPVIGIILGCCRCYGKCGGKQQTVESSDVVWTIVYIICIILFGAMFMFGLIGAFQTNENIEEGFKNVKPIMKTSMNDIEIYFDDALKHMNLLLIENFDSLRTVLNTELDETGVWMNDELLNSVDPDDINEILRVLQSLKSVHNSMNAVIEADIELTNEIVDANMKIDGIKNVAKEVLEDVIAKGIEPPINTFIATIQNDIDDILDIQWDLSHKPNFGTLFDTLTELFTLEIINTVQNGLDELTHLHEIMPELIVDLNKIKIGIQETGDKIEAKSTDTLNSVKQIVDIIKNKSNNHINNIDKYLNNYDVFRYSTDLIVCIVLVAILAFIFIGIIFGLILKKPSYKSDYCNAKLGSSCLLVSVRIMFITSILLVIIVIAHMSGMFVQVGVCEPLRMVEPTSFFDKFHIFQNVVDVNISSVIKECYKDQSIYNVFDLEPIIKLEDIKNLVATSGIQNQITNLIEKFNEVTFSNIVNKDHLRALNVLSECDLPSSQFDEIKVLPNEVFEMLPFTTLSEKLEMLVSFLRPSNRFNDEIATIDEVIMSIQIVIRISHNSMNNLIEKIKENGMNAEVALGNNDEFENTIVSLTQSTFDVTNKFQVITTFLHETIEDFTGQIVTVIDTYLQRVVSTVRDDVGKCGPMATATTTTTIATCDNILNPMNGFWFCLFWCLLLFVPMIIVSIKMASLFKKVRFSQFDPYSDVCDELEFYMPNEHNTAINKRQVYEDIDDELERRYGIKKYKSGSNNFEADNKGYVPDEFERRYRLASSSDRNYRYA